ncbi:MAG: hypothetical protein FJZ93_09715 [Chloroflexi bacterium]|nr:hypothetical protein [Chloroflexota bacterium]
MKLGRKFEETINIKKSGWAIRNWRTIDRRWIGVISTIAICIQFMIFSAAISPLVKGQSNDSYEEIELKYDDGSARDCISAVAPILGGHLVEFQPPTTPLTIKKVRIAGMFSPKAPHGTESKTLDVEIWDQDKKVLHSATYPYTKFSTAGWVDFDVPNIEVNGKFYAHIYTESPRYGLHICADDSVVNKHSEVTLRTAQRIAYILPYWPYDSTLWFGDKSKVNWMIRVVGTPAGTTTPQEATTGKATDLSFEAVEYRNEQYGFTLQYPKKWTRRIPFNNPDVLLAVDPAYMTPPVLIIAVSREPETRNAFMGVLRASAEVLVGQGSFNPSLVKFVREADVATADGMPANDIEFQAQLGRFSVEGLCTVARKADISIVVIVATWDNKSPYDNAEYSNITHSLRFIEKPAEPPPEKATTHKATPSGYNMEYLLSEQVVDVSSLRKAHITWTLVVRNNANAPLTQLGWCLRSPVASLAVTRIYDWQGDIEFEYVDGKFPIPAGQSDAETVRIQLRSPVSKGETYKFTMELDAVTDIAQDYAYAFCDTENIFRRARLEIIAPRHYAITVTQPAQTGVNVVGERQIAAIEAENVNRLMLVAHFASTGNVSSRAFEDLSESISSASVVVSKPPLSWAVLACAVVAAVAVISWFLFLVPRRKRRLAQLSRISEEYERKLAQWEKEGYDVKGIREKLKGSGGD